MKLVVGVFFVLQYRVRMLGIQLVVMQHLILRTVSIPFYNLFNKSLNLPLEKFSKRQLRTDYAGIDSMSFGPDFNSPVPFDCKNASFLIMQHNNLEFM